MPDSETDFKLNNDEFTRIFDQYRARIEEITRQTEHGLQDLSTHPGEAPARNGSNHPLHKAAVPVPGDPAAPAAMEQPRILEKQPVKESEKILKEARKQAQKIIDEAEERAKKEARKKTQAQVDKLLARAQQQAEDLVSQARKLVEEERDAAITATKNHMESILTDITEQARRETLQKSTQTINNAREEAEKMTAEVAAAGMEINRLIRDTAERMRQHVSDIEARLQAESTELSRLIAESQLKIERITAAVQPPEPAGQGTAASGATPAGHKLMMRVLGDRSNGKNGTEPLFFGQIEVRADSTSLDYTYFKNLKKYLVKVPGIKHLQESASEKDFSALFDITEPLPLLELLRQMPLVEQVLNETAHDISVEFKAPA